MFSLHESTQRRVCRVVFVIFALIPAVVTLAWIAYALRPWREADWKRTLSQQLHVRGTVEHATSPRPGITLLKHVRLADLRTNRPLGEFGEIRAQWRGQQLMLVADELRIEAGSFPKLATTLATWMSATELPAVDLQARQLTILGTSGQTLPLLQARVQCLQQERLMIRATLPPKKLGGTAHTLQLVVRQRGDQTTATFDTSSARVPSWLLADLLPTVSRCAEGTLSGSLQLEGDAQQVRGSLQGRLENLSISSWIGPDSAHRVEGTVRVELDELTWQNDRVVTAQGSLYAGEGAISHSLLFDAIKRFYCVPGPLAGLKSNSQERMQAFDEMACGFRVSSEGITVKGKCDSLVEAAPGCMLAIDGRPLLMEPAYANLPVAQLVQVLSQPASSWLPASQEAHSMAGKLPLPSTNSKADEEVANRLNDSTSR